MSVPQDIMVTHDAEQNEMDTGLPGGEEKVWKQSEVHKSNILKKNGDINLNDTCSVKKNGDMNFQ